MMNPSQTPLVDSCLVDPMRLRGGLLDWARTVELRCRAAKAALESLSPVATSHTRLPFAEEVLASLNAMLAETPNGRLRRVLSRPPWQLDEASPSRAALERRVRTLTSNATEAKDVHAALQRYASRLHDLTRRVEASYPNLLAELIRRERLDLEELLDSRRALDVLAAERRLGRVEREFSKREDALRHADVATNGWTVLATEAATPVELASVCAVSLVERSRASRRAARHGPTYQALLEHLDACRANGGPEPTRGTAKQAVVVEDLLVRSGRAEGVARMRGAESAIWCAALASGPDTNAAYRVRPSVLRALTPEPVADGANDSPSSLYMIPVGDGLVLISRRWTSAVRVWTANVALGADVEGQVIPERVNASSSEAARDVAELVGGLLDATAWYRTRERVRVHVIASFGDGCLGRLRGLGTVDEVMAPRWAGRSADSSHFRLFAPQARVSRKPPEEAAQLAAADGTQAGELFAGFVTEEVRTGIEGAELAWRRKPSGRGRAAMRALEDEWILFYALGDRPRSQVRALRPLAWTGGVHGRGRYPLYRMPLAITPANTPAFDSLVALNLQWRLFTIAGIAKAIRQIHQTGAALGTVDHRQFVYAIELNGPTQLAVPRPILAYAPAVCSLGEPHVGNTRLDHDELVYRRLRTPLLNPFAASSTLSDASHDVFSWGVCALDLLAVAPFAQARVHYVDLLDAVRANQNVFADADLALRIAEALTSTGKLEKLTRLVSAVCDGLGPRPEKWRELL